MLIPESSKMNTQTRALDSEIARAWQTAASDPGIKVTAPFNLKTRSGVVETFEALVHEFGGPKGTVTGQVAAGDSGDSRKELGITCLISPTPIVDTIVRCSSLR
jgi:hypothetical protein